MFNGLRQKSITKCELLIVSLCALLVQLDKRMPVDFAKDIDTQHLFFFVKIEKGYVQGVSAKPDAILKYLSTKPTFGK